MSRSRAYEALPRVLMQACTRMSSRARVEFEALLPRGLLLLEGPACPEHLAPLDLIDQACGIAARPGLIFTTSSALLHLRGSNGNLLGLESRGADIRAVDSALESIDIARGAPKREVVFFGIDFETTLPAHAMALLRAERLRLRNFFVLLSHARFAQTLRAALCARPERVQAVLVPAERCVISGFRHYESFCRSYRMPVVVSRSGTKELLDAVACALRMLESRELDVESRCRAVLPDGNRVAQFVMSVVFELVDRPWRGLGIVPGSGYALRERFASFDAQRAFAVSPASSEYLPQPGAKPCAP